MSKKGATSKGSPLRFWNDLEMTEQEKQAMVTALRLLAATPKSRKGLLEKLTQKGYSTEVLEITLNKLEARGILNDRGLAESLFQSFVNYKPSGRKRIAFEMKKRGIRDNLIQEVLEGYPPAEERQKALELAQLKWNQWSRLEPIKRQKKVYDFLVRRGFDFQIAREVTQGTAKASS